MADLNEEFDAKYMDAYGVSPDDLGPFHAQSYDSVQVIADAISRVAEVDGDGNLVKSKDDIVIRIRPDGEGSIIDLRSISRVGLGDLGANAKRIETFITEFRQ